MSLKEAYSLAHSAQCRLQMEASRPGRNLRFVVGHLMHYESLRLRIVEIEHDISKSERAQAVSFKGTGHVDRPLHHKPSTGQLGRRSPSPKPADDGPLEDEEPEDLFEDEDDEDETLGLTRFPSGSSRPPRQPPPELEPDDPAEDDDDDDEPLSPEEPDQATLEAAMKGQGSDEYARLYNGIRKCPCHGKTEAPMFEKMWQLPGGAQDGKTRVVAQISEDVPVMGMAGTVNDI